MQICGHDISVCGWSLQPKGMAELVEKVRRLELRHVQIELVSLLALDESKRAGEIAILRESGLVVTGASVAFAAEDFTSLATLRATAGLIPDERWIERRDLALRAAALAAETGIKFVEFHVGFIQSSSEAGYRVLVDRVSEIAHGYAKLGVDLLMETGQESASELLQFINDANCRNLGVNFDSANMVLYGTDDPIDAVGVLNRHIRHVHLKDAVESNQPRVQWGKEVPLGSGEVDFDTLLDALERIDYTGPLCIERESGNDRAGDIKAAIGFMRELELSEE